MYLERIKKLTYIINTVILLIVIVLAGFFFYCKADFLVYFSIPTAVVYVIGYYLIKIEKLDHYVRMVYLWITLYMSLTTVCLGYKLGFHLYCMSMIPIIFSTEYMAGKLSQKRVNASLISALIVICYLAATGYAAFAGPVYSVDDNIAGVFWLMNSVIVLSFLIIYSKVILKLVGDSENMLTEIAHTDRLTGLYNRHHMMESLNASANEEGERYVAMIDIDGFKQINDTYGHNAGDYVLRTVSQLMKETCKDCVISRWGGEEFLIMAKGKAECEGRETLETLRKKTDDYDFISGKKQIDVTITIGAADFKPEYSVDEWIRRADEKLYIGKNGGKNQVVI